MPTPRIGALLLAGAVTVLATGCALTRLSAQPPAHIGIAGDWKVDWAHSDPLPPVLAQIARVAPAARAAEIATVMPRSLNEPVGFIPR